ncbi:hypothetical protein [Nocardia mangyaensis]|nr:hypothetical protein [Nocardia mangyaensis]MDO3645720.1 hypothetical protein [Nocardia mangyaensis]
MRESVLAYVNEQCNATRVDGLLPRPLADNSVPVAVALDALYWRQNVP